MTELIPAIDLIGGRCVRLTRGEYDSAVRYEADPLETARGFEAAGLRRLHLVDLDGARAGKPVNLAVLEKIASGTALRIDFSGGLRTGAAIEEAFAAGADMVTVGSAAVTEPDLLSAWLKLYGSEKVILGADFRNGMAAYSGWREQSSIGWKKFLSDFSARGITRVACTDISKDGTLAGPAVDFYREIMTAFPALRLTASGGVSSLEDIRTLRDLGLSGVIIGKAIYEGRIKLADLAEFLC